MLYDCLQDSHDQFNYSVSGENAVWYSLDNRQNVTISAPRYLNVSQGVHLLKIYANNTPDNAITSKKFVDY